MSEKKENQVTETKLNAQEQATLNPAQTPGNYVIVTESGGQRRCFAVYGGTVQIAEMSALKGAFELK